MPRHRRKLSETKIYHIMIRGNEKKNIFFDDDDRNHFLDTLHEKNKERMFTVYAYCLMDNHVHLLLNEGREEIARIMKRINTSYAYYFNKKYKRVGHLFQDRFKSESIESDRYLIAAARYIHNNPVKANFVEVPELYKWSSYNMYIKGRQNYKSIVEPEALISIFSEDWNTAVRYFIEFSNQESDDEFIEYIEAWEKDTEIEGEKEASAFIGGYLTSKGHTLDTIMEKQNIAIRNELITRLKEKSNLSVRQLAVILGMDRNIIQRIK